MKACKRAGDYNLSLNLSLFKPITIGCYLLGGCAGKSPPPPGELTHPPKEKEEPAVKPNKNGLELISNAERTITLTDEAACHHHRLMGPTCELVGGMPCDGESYCHGVNLIDCVDGESWIYDCIEWCRRGDPTGTAYDGGTCTSRENGAGCDCCNSEELGCSLAG